MPYLLYRKCQIPPGPPQITSHTKTTSAGFVRKTIPLEDSRQIFYYLYQVGETGVKQVRAYYESQGYVCIGVCNDKRYDLKFRSPAGKNLHIEVKTDCTQHNNLAIELRSRGKPSGIHATTADIYCIYFTKSGQLWHLDTHRLRQYLSTQAIRQALVKTVNADTWVALIPKKEARTHQLGTLTYARAIAPQVQAPTKLLHKAS